MARRGWRLVAGVAVVGVLGGLVFASDGAAYVSPVSITLTASGPSPGTLNMDAGSPLVFYNRDSVTHTVVFPNEGCTFSVPPGYMYRPGGQAVDPGQQTLPPACSSDFPFYVGSYSYTVDGAFSGAVETTPSSDAVNGSRARTSHLGQ